MLHNPHHLLPLYHYFCTPKKRIFMKQSNSNSSFVKAPCSRRSKQYAISPQSPYLNNSSTNDTTSNNPASSYVTKWKYKQDGKPLSRKQTKKPRAMRTIYHFPLSSFSINTANSQLIPGEDRKYMLEKTEEKELLYGKTSPELTLSPHIKRERTVEDIIKRELNDPEKGQEQNISLSRNSSGNNYYCTHLNDPLLLFKPASKLEEDCYPAINFNLNLELNLQFLMNADPTPPLPEEDSIPSSPSSTASASPLMDSPLSFFPLEHDEQYFSALEDDVDYGAFIYTED